MTDLHGHCTRMTRTGTDRNSGSDVKDKRRCPPCSLPNMAAEPKCSRIPMAFLVALWWLLHDEVCAHREEFEMVQRNWYPMLHHGNEPNEKDDMANESLRFGGGPNYITFNFAKNNYELDQSVNETSCPARRLTWIGTTDIFQCRCLQGDLESGEDWCPPHGRCIRRGLVPGCFWLWYPQLKG